MVATPAHPQRIIYYHQMQFDDKGFVSILPVLSHATGVTHVILAAIHLNAPDNVSLNNDPYTSPRFEPLWDEVRRLQAAGVRVMGMLGGAAQGSFTRLDGTAARFEEYYAGLAGLIRLAGLDGLDLDVEEAMSLGGIVRLIDRLKADFGQGFIVTLAPVATALLGLQNLSGFNHSELEKGLGARIAWYNVQFYCGWGDMSRPDGVELLVARGWDPAKIVIGLITNAASGAGFVADDDLRRSLTAIARKWPRIGGVMGWEYFNSVTSAVPDVGTPWVWAELMNDIFTKAANTAATAAKADTTADNMAAATAATTAANTTAAEDEKI